jgi:hypothetical protein
MGTGVTPPVWSPENRPAGCQASPAARFTMVGHKHKVVHATPGKVARPQEPKQTLWHLPSALCHLDRIGEATGSAAPAVAGGEPIGVVKLLGC